MKKVVFIMLSFTLLLSPVTSIFADDTGIPSGESESFDLDTEDEITIKGQ